MVAASVLSFLLVLLTLGAFPMTGFHTGLSHRTHTGDPRRGDETRDVASTPRQEQSADWVARQIENRASGRDARSEIRMLLFDRRGGTRERKLVLTTLRGASKGGAAPDAPAGDRLLVRLTYPNDIRGTGFLVWEHADAEDERFLYLPALGRVRRIAGAESQERFVGSDFTYEDIGGREFDDYTYTLLSPDDVWEAPDGTRHSAYRLESRSKDPDATYPRVVSLVRKDIFSSPTPKSLTGVTRWRRCSTCAGSSSRAGSGPPWKR